MNIKYLYKLKAYKLRPDGGMEVDEVGLQELGSLASEEGISTVQKQSRLPLKQRGFLEGMTDEEIAGGLREFDQAEEREMAARVSDSVSEKKHAVAASEIVGSSRDNLKRPLDELITHYLEASKARQKVETKRNAIPIDGPVPALPEYNVLGGEADEILEGRKLTEADDTKEAA